MMHLDIQQWINLIKKKHMKTKIKLCIDLSVTAGKILNCLGTRFTVYLISTGLLNYVLDLGLPLIVSLTSTQSSTIFLTLTRFLTMSSTLTMSRFMIMLLTDIFKNKQRLQLGLDMIFNFFVLIIVIYFLIFCCFCSV